MSSAKLAKALIMAIVILRSPASRTLSCPSTAVGRNYRRASKHGSQSAEE
jgi:hypothetical protein